jgi:hypothetical protein
LAPGSVFLASKLGLPLVLMGYGYDRPRRVRKAWDQFAIPRLGSRARAVVSDEIFIPSDLNRDGLEQHRQMVERRLNDLTDEAEHWAAAGIHKPGQRRLFRCGKGQAV